LSCCSLKGNQVNFGNFQTWRAERWTAEAALEVESERVRRQAQTDSEATRLQEEPATSAVGYCVAWRPEMTAVLELWRDLWTRVLASLVVAYHEVHLEKGREKAAGVAECPPEQFDR